MIERDLYSGLDRGQAPAPWLHFPQAYPIPYTFVSVYQSTDVFVYLSPIHRPRSGTFPESHDWRGLQAAACARAS